jgi:protein involved in polysaccharide export with SLBB domain
MIKVLLSAFVGAWVAFTGVAHAQLSTFPAPPPLAPSAPDSPAPGDTSPSAAPAAAPAEPNNSQPLSPALPPSTSDMTNATPSPPAVTSAGIPISAASLSSMTALDDKITLQPGDRISFRVIEDQDDAVPRIVTDTGEVDFPYIGRIKVAGQTCLQVARQVKQLLEVNYYKRATVIIGLDVIFGKTQDVTHNYAWVTGQVRQIGPQELSATHPMTVSQIILRAGGFGDFADQRRVRLIHRADLPSGTTVPEAAETANGSDSKAGEIVDVKAVFDGQSALDPIVKPDDYIVVPKRLVNF